MEERQMNLDMIRSSFPDFQIENFGMFDQITLLKWEKVLDENSWEEHKNLVLEMTSPHNYKILIEFIDVNSLRFRGNGQISGFYIMDMTERGYENNVKYEVGDYEEDEIQFYCSDVVVKNFLDLN